MKTNPLYAFSISLLLLSGLLSAGEVIDLKGTMSVNQGSFNYKVDLDLPQGIAGVKPKLALLYSSAGSNGYLGKGWSVDGFSAITRCAATKAIDGKIRGVKLDSEDRYCLDGKRLIPVEGDDGALDAEYRTYIESDSRIVSVGGADGDPDHFVVYTKSGDIYTYGSSSDSRRLIGEKRLGWQLTRIEDRFGNGIDFHYATDHTAGYSRPDRISYGVGNIVRFVYGDREDTFHGYTHGKPSIMTKKLERIEISYRNSKIRTYTLGYRPQSVSTDPLLLESLTECNADQVCSKPLRFSWEGRRGDPAAAFEHFEEAGSFSSDRRDALYFADLDGDGLQDYIKSSENYLNFYRNKGDNSFEYIKRIYARGVGRHVGVKYGDFDGDGVVDIFYFILGGKVGIIFNKKDFVFDSPRVYQWDSSTSYRIGDFDNDGIDDILFKRYIRNDDVYNGFVRIDPSRSETVLMRGAANKNFEQKIIFRNPKDSEGFIFGFLGMTIGDFDSDGILDILLSKDGLLVTGSSGLDFSNSIATGISGSATNYQVIDFNGDGAMDIYMKYYDRNGHEAIYLNDGTGHFTFSHTIDVASTHSSPVFMDINGDGYTDIYWYYTEGADKVFLNDGHGNFSFQYTLDLSDYLAFADVDGDGRMDILEKDGNGKIYTNTARPYRITRITDSFGNRSEVTYSSISDPKVYTMGTAATAEGVIDISSPAVQVVSHTRTYDGAGRAQDQYYHYEGLRRERFRGSLGFERVSAYDATSGVKSETRYSQAAHTTGMVLSTQSRLVGRDISDGSWQDLEGELLSDASVGFEVITQDETHNLRIRTTHKSEKSYIQDQLMKTTLTRYDRYDRYGNVLEMESVISGGGEQFVKRTVSSYDNDPDSWMLGRLRAVSVTHEGYGDTKTRHSSFAYDADTGVLTDEWIEPDDPELALHKHYAYDIHGNKVLESLVNIRTNETRSSTYRYDDSGERLLSSTNALGQTATNLSFDARFGSVTRSQDPNGLISETAYDAWGRKIRSKAPDGTETRLTYRLDSTVSDAYYRITSTTRLPSGKQLPATSVIYDALGRKLREQTVRFDGAQVFVDYYYDARGRMYRKSSPHTADEKPPVCRASLR